MAGVKLPKYTWAADVLTFKGSKKVVYSTVTGKVVGEIKDGKFVQTVDKIPQPDPKKPAVFTVPETARAGGIENTIAANERDAAYYKSVAENINKSDKERTDARNEYNRLQGEIAKLQGQSSSFAKQTQSKTDAVDRAKAREKIAALKSEYQTIEKKYNALLDKWNDPVALKYGSRMYQIQNEVQDIYQKSLGENYKATDIIKLLSGVLPAAKSTNAPTGTPSEQTPVPATSSDVNVPQGNQKQSNQVSPVKAPAVSPSSTTKKTPVTAAPVVSPAVAVPQGTQDLQTLLKKTEFWYDLPDYIFQTIPELGDILVKAVAGGWDDAKFLSAAKLTKWWQSNSATIRQRIIDKASYDELKAAGQDVSKSTYGQYLSKNINSIKAQAKTLAGVALNDEQAQQVVEKIYNGNLDDDPVAIKKLLIPFIGKTTDRYAGTDVTTYGGKALQDYQMLQAIAKANGLNLKDVLPQISAVTAGGDLEKAVLQGLASGDIDINRVAQNARMVAAQGQPKYVRDLLNQGYDLEQIYSPYKTTMAGVLEINPDQIDLNDPTLRSAINNNGDMNIYDFKKALRKDSRWQYTQGARQEVSDSVLNVLRDFGFQG